ncbi:MAG: hypothetical protein ACRCST_03085 [Turicibacter sp.]
MYTQIVLEIRGKGKVSCLVETIGEFTMDERINACFEKLNITRNDTSSIATCCVDDLEKLRGAKYRLYGFDIDNLDYIVLGGE